MQFVEVVGTRTDCDAYRLFRRSRYQGIDRLGTCLVRTHRL